MIKIIKALFYFYKNNIFYKYYFKNIFKNIFKDYRLKIKAYK